MPAIEGYTLVTAQTDTDLTGHQYKIVNIDTDDNTVVAATDASKPSFVVHEVGAEANTPVAIGVGGVLKVEADGSSPAIVQGDALISDANGVAVKVAAASGEQFIIGYALEATSVAGELIRFVVHPGVVTT